MAANYWASTQRKYWLFTRERLAEIRDGFKEKDKNAHTQFPLPDQRLLNIYFNQRRFKSSNRRTNTKPRQNSLSSASECQPDSKHLPQRKYISSGTIRRTKFETRTRILCSPPHSISLARWRSVHSISDSSSARLEVSGQV